MNTDPMDPRLTALIEAWDAVEAVIPDPLHSMKIEQEAPGRWIAWVPVAQGVDVIASGRTMTQALARLAEGYGSIVGLAEVIPPRASNLAEVTSRPVSNLAEVIAGPTANLTDSAGGVLLGKADAP